MYRTLGVFLQRTKSPNAFRFPLSGSFPSTAGITSASQVVTTERLFHHNTAVISPHTAVTSRTQFRQRTQSGQYPPPIDGSGEGIMHSVKSLLGLREIRFLKTFPLHDYRTGQLSRASYRHLGSVDSYLGSVYSYLGSVYSYLGSADSFLGSVASMLRVRKEGLSKEEAAQKALDVHASQVKMVCAMTEVEKGSATTRGTNILMQVAGHDAKDALSALPPVGSTSPECALNVP
jgi:hypothetical protein